jgi:magnesium chelatase family protein
MTMSRITLCGEPIDLAQIAGQEHVKRALEVAAAGQHHILLIGSSDADTTALARALLGLRPPLEPAEVTEVSAIRVAAGLGRDGDLTHAPCYALAPPSTSSVLFGGRTRPGAVSLGHRGVLLLDDLPAFGPYLERLAQVLDERAVILERAAGQVTLPAVFQLAATMRSCPCGWFGDITRACTCTTALIRRHQRRIPEALRERIAIHVEVPPRHIAQLTDERPREPSTVVRERVAAARWRQAAREASATNVPATGRVDSTAHALLRAAARQLDLTPATIQRTLGLARTIADLAGEQQVGVAHVAEGLQYRSRWAL